MRERSMHRGALVALAARSALMLAFTLLLPATLSSSKAARDSVTEPTGLIGGFYDSARGKTYFLWPTGDVPLTDVPEVYAPKGLYEYDVKSCEVHMLIDAARIPEARWADVIGITDENSLIIAWWMWEPHRTMCKEPYWQVTPLSEQCQTSVGYVDTEKRRVTVVQLPVQASDLPAGGVVSYINGWLCRSDHYKGVAISPDDSVYRLDLGRFMLNRERNHAVQILPMDMGSRPLFLVLDATFGFRVFDEQSRLVFQGGYVPDLGAIRVGGEGEAIWTKQLLRGQARNQGRMDVATFLSVSYYPLTIFDRDTGLIFLYDWVVNGVLIASPLAVQYRWVMFPEDGREVVDAGLTGDDGYMLLFEDGSTFVADYSDIAEQVRSGKLDPLGPLRELMGLEEE